MPTRSNNAFCLSSRLCPSLIVGLVVLAALSIAGARPVALWLAYPLVNSDPLRRVDAIVVLGAGTYGAMRLTPESAYRLLYGVQLLKEGYAPILVLSGGSHRDVSDADAAAMASAARDLGVDATALLLDEQPSSTAAQAASLAEIAARHKIRSIALVTSPLKSFRAVRAFRRVGFEVISAPGVENRKTQVTRLLVGEDHLVSWLGLILETIYEYVVIGLYWAKGWI